MAALAIVVAALAMVLVVSGVLKVRDPGSTTPMLDVVRLPSSPVAVNAVAALEIVAGASALVLGGRVATLVVGLLYAGFALIGVVLLRSGSTVPCGCFGQRSAAMTPLHVGVNATAAVVALAAVALGTSGLYADTGDRSAAVPVAATVAALLAAAAVVALLTVVPERMAAGAAAAPLALGADPVAADGGPGGDGAPGGGTGVAALHPLEGVGPDDRVLRIEPAGSGRVVLLAFLTTGCTTCSHFWQVFGGLGASDLPGERTDLVVVTRGDDLENANRVRDLAPAGFPVLRSTAAWRDYGVVAGPYFVLVDGRGDRLLAEGAATTWADVAGLLRQAVGARPGTGVAE